MYKLINHLLAIYNQINLYLHKKNALENHLLRKYRLSFDYLN
jgi:hypothetical protein